MIWNGQIGVELTLVQGAISLHLWERKGLAWRMRQPSKTMKSEAFCSDDHRSSQPKSKTVSTCLVLGMVRDIWAVKAVYFGALESFRIF